MQADRFGVPGERAQARRTAATGSGFRTEFAAFTAQVVRSAGRRRVALTVGLLLVAGATEGLGLMLLLPILQIGAGGMLPQNAVGLFVADQLAHVGLPMTLPVLLGMLIALVACRSAMEWARDIMAADVQLRFVADMRSRTMAAVAGASWHFLGRQSNAFLHAMLCRDVEALRMSVIFSLNLSVQLVLLATNVGVALYLSPSLTVAAAVLGVLLALAARKLVRRAQANGRRFEQHQRMLHSEVADFVSSLKLVKSMSAEKKHLAAFHASSEELYQATRQHKASGATLRAMMQLSAAVAVSALVLVSQHGAALPFTAMLVLAMVFVRMVPVLKEIYLGLQAIANALPAYTEITQVARECAQHAEPARPAAVAPLPLRRQLRLEDVSYHHLPGTAALDRVNATIAAGSMVALVGPSGAGKTTLADLVLGLLSPHSGRMTVDDVEIGGATLHAWRQSVAYVPQEPFFLNASVRDNLAWTAADATEAAMLAALEQAQALDFILRREGGLDAMIGDHGRQLSGGERQRLALARALLRQPSVLVLDEPTSALDPANARLVHSAIARLRGSMTVIIIVHDLDQVRDADQVLVLERGVLVESGNWHELAFTRRHGGARGR